MGINTESDVSATLTIGPTSEGNIRLFVEAEGGIEIPLDFDPQEAREIAEEIRAAAEMAEAAGRRRGGASGGGGGGGGSRKGSGARA